MSCDYSVWHTPRRLSAVEAGRLHTRLCEGDTSDVLAHPGIESFYRELTALHPEIGDTPADQAHDADLCPWSVAFDRSDGHIILCCIWSKADYVGELVARLAARHGLAFYDPQSETITYPRESRTSRPWWRFW